MTSHVDQAVAARIAAARRQTEERKRQRAELNEARQHGLSARKRSKLTRLAEDNQTFAASGV